MKGPHLLFEEHSNTGRIRKTLRYIVKSTHADQEFENATLGYIYWYSPWRRYIYHPHPATLYDVACLKEIIEFIEGLMSDRLAT